MMQLCNHSRMLYFTILPSNRWVFRISWLPTLDGLFCRLLYVGSCWNKLDIGRNLIDDIAINALTNALLNNSMLKTLSCYENPAVTPAGWMNLSTILRNPTSALEVLYVRADSINDEVLYSFVQMHWQTTKKWEKSVLKIVSVILSHPTAMRPLPMCCAIPQAS